MKCKHCGTVYFINDCSIEFHKSCKEYELKRYRKYYLEIKHKNNKK